MNFPELMFYAEAEGLLPTREGKINAVINELKDLSYYDENIVAGILHKYDLRDLTPREIRYINASI